MTALLDEPVPESQTLDKPDAVQPFRSAGAWLDFSTALIAWATLIHVAAELSTPGRSVLALLFALFVPGWVTVRTFGARASLLSVVAAIALSISFMLITGQLLVLFADWRWSPVALLAAGVFGVLGTRNFWTSRYVMSTPTRLDWDRLPVRRTLLWAATTIGGLTTAALGIRATPNGGFDETGLFSSLAAGYWVGVGALIVALVLLIRLGSKFVWPTLVALVITLHGLPGLLEPHPRFNSAWIHTGFIRHISENGTLLRDLDARFSWAGFFSGGAFLQRLADVDTMLWMVRFAPIFFNLVSLVLVTLIARRVGATTRRTMVAATLFCIANWIGQDYFSPQATAFMLYLTLVTVLLTAFASDPGSLTGWRHRVLRPSSVAVTHLSARNGTLIVIGCYVVIVALVMSHQLTPGFLSAALILLIATRSIRLWAIVVFTIVVFLGWLSFGADAFWMGHFEKLTGSVGQVSSLVNENVNERAGTGSSSGREAVLRARIGTMLVVWLLAGLSLALHWWRRRTPVALGCLLVAPFPMLLLQPYGGEMILRIAYFTLPAAVVLIALMPLPAWLTRSGRRESFAWAGFALALLLAVPVFITARFGNESFEAFSDEDVDLSRTMYEVIPPNSELFVAEGQAIVYSERVAEIRVRDLPRDGAEIATSEISDFLAEGPVFVLLSESQEAYGIVVRGLPSDWMQELRRNLVDTGRYVVRRQSGTGVLLELIDRS